MYDKIRALVHLTLRDPQAAARGILALRLRGEALVMALGLAAALNGLAFGLAGGTSASPLASIGPFGFAAVLIIALLGYALALERVGRFFGGVGRFEGFLALLIWLQLLRAAVQFALILLSVIPVLAMLLIVVASVFGLWVTVNFIDAAHGFRSLGQAAATLVLSGIALILSLALLFAFFGPLLFPGAFHV